MSGELYVSAGFVQADAHPPQVRVARTDTGTRVHVEIGNLAMLLPLGTARALRDDLIDAALGDPS